MIVKKRFKLENLGCAHCAAKMEDAIARIEGVNSVSISFMTQKLSLEADDARFERVLHDAQAVIRKIEPDCILVP